MNKSNYNKAFKEVYIILKSMGDDILNRIPTKLMILIEEHMDKNYIFILDENSPIESQELLNETLGIISLIYRDYIASEEERKKLLEEDKNRLKNLETELSEKYNYNNLFKEKKIKNEEEILNNIELIVYEEKWYIKILSKLSNLFKKSKGWKLEFF